MVCLPTTYYLLQIIGEITSICLNKNNFGYVLYYYLTRFLSIILVQVNSDN